MIVTAYSQGRELRRVLFVVGKLEVLEEWPGVRVELPEWLAVEVLYDRVLVYILLKDQDGVSAAAYPE